MTKQSDHHQTYPVCLNLSGKLCIVVGGGVVAERKVQGILSGSGSVRVVSPVVTPTLRTLADQGVIEWREQLYRAIDLDGAFLVFAATNIPEVQQAVLREARALGLLVNIADDPQACDFYVPASFRRGDMTLCVATNGKSPAVAAMVRRRLERDFGEEYAQLTSLMALLRDRILIETAGNHEEKKILFQKILHDDIVDWLRDHRWDKIQQHLQEVFGCPVDFDPGTLTKENP
ncbi:MAG: bifunctional precorrin-2 dehydrogenase/sirohydrochlorin ferrochelatase [Desulfobulbaceae bacterium]|nr:bifunctional precorrin-2 dehydrogenase/sirohydrochlorin ferrochelatase [Desulfobulbaceae bacterium]